MSHLLRAVLASAAALGLCVAGSASGKPTELQFQRCQGLVKGAAWTEGVGGASGRWAGVGTPSGSGRSARRAPWPNRTRPSSHVYLRAGRSDARHSVQVPHRSPVVGVGQIAFGAGADGRGWLLDDDQRSGGSLLLLAAAPVVLATEAPKAAIRSPSGTGGARSRVRVAPADRGAGAPSGRAELRRRQAVAMKALRRLPHEPPVLSVPEEVVRR
jgi:hypothetical protein